MRKTELRPEREERLLPTIALSRAGRTVVRAVLSALFVVMKTCGGMELGKERGLVFVTEDAMRVDAATQDLHTGEFMRT